MDLTPGASRKKLGAQRRRHALLYKGIAAARVTFCGEEEWTMLHSDVSKPHEKDFFGISAVGVELSYSQKVGSDSEPLRGRLQPSR